jgi:diguanylate cyclase (GGDEF)-like protein
MGVDAADWQNHGRPGLLVGNFSGEALSLFAPDRDEGLVDVTYAQGLGEYSYIDQTTRLILLTASVMLSYAIVRRAQRLLHLAARDRLTGVYNRGQYDVALEFEVGRAMQLGHELSVAVLDLDRFKNINDTFGHAAGDRVLVEVAARLARGMRTTDMIARYGGEEFAVLFPQTGRAAAAVRVETLRAQIAALILRRRWGWRFTCSAGIAQLPADGLDAGTLLARADQRLLAAKRAGRDRSHADDSEALSQAEA